METVILMIDVFLLSISIILFLINYQKVNSIGQIERELGLRSHKAKNHTPTLGGIAILISTILFFTISAILNELDIKIYLLLIIPLLGYGILGFIDDWLILTKGKNDGISAGLKFFIQIVIAAIYFMIYLGYQFDTSIDLIFFKIDLKFLYGIFLLLAFSGFSNATNLTDGIDGLLGTSFILVLLSYALLSNQLIIQQFIAIMISAIMGFLVFNLPKAKIFMGNTTALAFGAVMVSIAVIIKFEISIFIFGFLYLLEVISVMMQVSYYKLTKGKRIFKMAPLHHHFEIIYNTETKALKLMILIQIFSCILGLIIFKIFIVK